MTAVSPRRALLATASALVALALSASTLLAQTRTISGQVLEEGSRAPITAAQLQVQGTNLGALTREDGRFTIAGVASGDVVLVVRRLGYPMTRVPVGATTNTVEIVLKKDVLNLDQVVVTGQATGISRRNLANDVASVSAAEMTKVSAQSIENAMQGKIAGAQISQSTGAPGGGNRIRIRGISSILGSAQPLYVIDGVIVSDVSVGSGTNKVTRASGTSISVGNQEAPVNRIADLNPNDIENVDVLKGSAAAAIYGSKASGGVIIITTKRGKAGKPRFSLRMGAGTSDLAYRNDSRHFKTLADAVAVFGAGITPFYDPNRQLNYETLAYGNNPLNSDLSLSVSGGSEDTRYFVSASRRNEEGIVANTFARKTNVRLNLDQRISSRINLQVGTEVLNNAGDRGLFGNDNAGNSIAYALTKIPSFLDLRRNADGSWPVNLFYPSNPLQTIDQFENSESVWRNITTSRLTADLITGNNHTLQFIAFGGVDLLNQSNLIYSPPTLQFEPVDGLPGTSANSKTTNVQRNLNLNMVHGWNIGSSLKVTSQVGTQFEERDFNQTRASAQNLLGGLEVVTSGTVRDVDESRLRVEDFGVFVQSEALWRDKLLLTVGARADRSSNNGDPAKYFLFPKAASSYRFPNLMPGVVDEAKLRVAYGETGNQPLYGQKFTNLDLSSVGGLGAFRVGTVRAASDLRPERQREFEIGTDLNLLRNRATFTVTGFRRNISDLLITRTLAPTSGFSSETSNGAEMQVTGAEVSINAFPIQTPTWGWTSRLNWGTNRSKVTKLPVPTFLLGAPQTGAIRIEQGKSATQLIGNDTLPQSGGRVVVPVVMGDGNPLWTAGWGNEVRFKGLSLYALLDQQKGGMLANGTWRHYDLGQNSIDYDDLDELGRKEGEVRRTSYLQVTRIYYQPTSFVKLREVTITLDLPQKWATSVWSGASGAKLSLSGRNLYWWTKFRGGDPEAQNFGQGGVPDAIQRNRELAAYPASRSFWLNFSVDF
ncbi:MAG TPA: SusC/RagA family TonB-linked outer membrane protein [Gemmatimonas aurantiaca]|uniref:SusC/RagA family TonB-linked outer membrane protein n=2 Tax=Gemmatimonas aurantiaca TaxID=173480 RepID=A0A3D4V9P6_9BACT|nr:SusC/RagA family TonB-linked outer membrane protein [Gemmatimonas aurantiaca]BAH39246.1 putative outer membrane protein [Gemmatimonas aurantiaca T-27]HCT57544.1 SusC/RagA family TonB-linked outer membrane protein [Gemmatimonas aurantiaca]